MVFAAVIVWDVLWCWHYDFQGSHSDHYSTRGYRFSCTKRSGPAFRVPGSGLPGSGFRVRVPGSGFRVPGSGFSGFRVPGPGFRVPGSGFPGSGFRVPRSGFRVGGGGSRVTGDEKSGIMLDYDDELSNPTVRPADQPDEQRLCSKSRGNPLKLAVLCQDRGCRHRVQAFA